MNFMGLGALPVIVIVGAVAFYLYKKKGGKM